MREQLVVYTALLGGYEELNEQPVASQSNVRFVCFTDDPQLRSDSWEIVLVEPLFSEDFSRSQRYLKMLPHLLFPEVKTSFYIDNTVVLKQPPERIAEQLHSGGFTNLYHSYRNSLIEEYLKVLRYGFDDSYRIYEQLNAMQLHSPELLDGPVYWGGLMIRDHHDEQVKATGYSWWHNVLRYSRRDQLSLPSAFHRTGLQPNSHKINNKKSEFHRWPLKVNRDRAAPIYSPTKNIRPMMARIGELEIALKDANKSLDNLYKTLFYRLKSRLFGKS